MKVAPFHSTDRDAEVFHDTDLCTEGHNIESENLAQGTGDLRRCDHCKRLSEAPFHSTNRDAEVFHDNDGCTEGHNIESENIADGTGGLRRCGHCERLNRLSS